MTSTTPPIIGFVAPSGSGKTTLMEQVITHLVQFGLKVAAIKHGHHPADPDIPGKDTHRFRQAGADTVLFACPQRWFMIQDTHNQPEPTLDQQTAKLIGHDIILVEGYKEENQPKIVIYRQGVGDRNFHLGLTQVRAIATDDTNLQTDLPQLPLNNPQAVAEFIRNHCLSTQ